MPSAPKSSQFTAACATFGMLPPRAFLMVAILFILTLSLVMLFHVFKKQI